MRVLVTAVPGVGHLLPVLPLAVAAQARGHEVLVGTGATLAPLTERSGIGHVDLGPPDLDAIRARLPGFADAVGRERARRMYTEGFASVAAAWVADDLLALANRWRPDVIVHDDMEMGSWLAAERLAVPHIAVQASAWRPWQRDSLSEPQRAVRRRLGLADDGQLSGRDGALWFATRPPSMRDPAFPLPAGHRHLRPEPDDRVAGPVVDSSWLLADRAGPRVAITLGTVNAGRVDILRPIVAGAAALPAEIVVALGADPATLGPVPPNVRVERYVAMSDLAPWADVVIHHAGAGTTLASLAAGRPMIVVPITADQFDNAADAVRTGAAIELDAGSSRPADVASALARLLEDDRFAIAARSVADEIRAMPGPDEAWLEIEALG